MDENPFNWSEPNLVDLRVDSFSPSAALYCALFHFAAERFLHPANCPASKSDCYLEVAR
jgi:hypothetical protein